MTINVLNSVEKIVRKGEHAGYQHFLLIPQCFRKDSFTGSLKVSIVWYRVNQLVKLHVQIYLYLHIFETKKVFYGNYYKILKDYH